MVKNFVEGTVVITGWEEVVRRSIAHIENTKEWIGLVGDSSLPGAHVYAKSVFNALLDAKKRGIKIRFITEITRENIDDCRKVMQYSELRHLDGIKGNFGASESAYLATATIAEDETIPQMIFSTAKAIVDQNNYLIEMLWNKAIPAEARFKEIEQGVAPERTEIVSGEENVLKFTMEHEIQIKETVDNCIDATTAVSFVKVTPMFEFMKRVGQRGVRSRIITEITRDNLKECKELAQIADVRHLAEVHGNFGITDGIEYRAAPHVVAGHPPRDLIRSTALTFVKQQQYFFDTLWEKSIPVNQRAKEIEEGKHIEKIEHIHDRQKSAFRAYDIIEGTKRELLILFATPQALAIAVSLDAPQRYGRIAEKGVKVKILVPRGKEIDRLIQETRLAAPLIEIKTSNENLNTRLTILISDRKELMSWELKDETTTDPFKEGGVATYTSFESLAGSYAIIFDNLWASTEIAENLRVANVKLESNEKTMKEFIDIAAHEIRTPIQPILGLAEVLKHSINKPEQLKMLDAIIRNANRLHRLQEDILDVAKIESNAITLNKVFFNIRDTVSELVKDFHDLLSSEVKIHLVDNSNNAMIKADKGRIVQVISNLLSNAVKFTRSGTIEIRIETTNHDLVISVIDTGTGIDPEIAPRLFTKFASKSDKGTGLGLFISKKIVEAHDGKLTAGNNKNGKGATLCFNIPMN